MTRLPDWARRALRTFLQAFIGTMAVTLIPWLNDIATAIGSGDDVVVDVNFLQGATFSAFVAGIIAIGSGVQNALEDNTPMWAPGKAPASEGQNPVPEPGP